MLSPPDRTCAEQDEGQHDAYQDQQSGNYSVARHRVFFSHDSRGTPGSRLRAPGLFCQDVPPVLLLELASFLFKRKQA